MKSAVATKREPDLSLVDAALENEGLTTKGEPGERVARLKAHYEKSYAQEQLLDCSECDLPTPDSEPACAFCGHGGEESTEPAQSGEQAIVPAEAAPLGDPDEAESRLDAAIGRYASANREMVGAGWDMGNAAREIHESRLYLARRGPGGQPVHRTFGDFCKSELKASSVHVLRMIDVAKEYTREQAVAIGTTKLSLTLRVGEEKRAPLLAMASDPDVSVRRLAEATREIVQEQPPRETDRRGRRNSNLGRPKKEAEPKPARPVWPPVEPAPESEDGEKPRRRLTVSVEEGDVEVHFYARRKKPGDRRRAFELADGPIGRICFLNGTQARIRLFRGEKGLFAKVEFTEIDESEEG